MSSRADLPSLLLSVVGLAVSAYLTVEHFTSPAILACPEGATINCTKVTTSPWAEVLGIPVAVFGLAYFVIMTILVTPRAWRVPALNPVRIAGGVLGVISVLYLIFVELFRVNALCLWCTAVHVCTVALFVAILWRVGSADTDHADADETDEPVAGGTADDEVSSPGSTSA